MPYGKLHSCLRLLHFHNMLLLIRFNPLSVFPTLALFIICIMTIAKSLSHDCNIGEVISHWWNWIQRISEKNSLKHSTEYCFYFIEQVLTNYSEKKKPIGKYFRLCSSYFHCHSYSQLILVTMSQKQLERRHKESYAVWVSFGPSASLLTFSLLGTLDFTP